MSDVEKVEKDLFPLIMYGSIAFMALVGYGFYVDSKNDYLYAELYKKARVVADLNKDGVTTSEEWDIAYQRAGIKHNFLNKIHLRYDQLEKIVNLD